ncbi:hypothetical protein L1987_81032 [Smallanthus sonchifolius]|uniref:Uncharacterized protein n=1 Tax=Smallanthus sonchifolius TaxID=185202 RepID=A0ACB8YNN5_9ASTR|nr:hypothetical protein L1987_81032 [Smallanthus sonchifolius]
MQHPYEEINEPPRKKLKLKLKGGVVEKENQICLPASKKLKLKLQKDVPKKTPKNVMQPEFVKKPKGVSKKTPKTSIQPEFVRGKKAITEDKDDDDDFVMPPPPKAILKTPQPKRTHKEISRSKNGKEPYFVRTLVVVNDINEREKRKSERYAVEWFDAKEETKNVVENNEEDNVSSKTTETNHEAEQNVYENLIHEESTTEAVNLQMVIVKDKTTVVDKNEDCECDTEEEDGDGKNTMKNPEVVDLEVIIKNLEYQIKSLKDEVEASKLRETTLVKENTNIKSERDMTMQRNEDLENMLKQLQLERDLQDDIKNVCNDDLETKSVEKSNAQQIEDWTFIYKTIRFCIKRRNVSLFYLNSIKEVLDLPIGDLKQMIHLKDDGKYISSKEQDTILCMKRNLIFTDEKMQPQL